MEIRPRKLTDKGGYLLMPLKANIPNPPKDWILTTCPRCGRECWDRKIPEEIKHSIDGKICTLCGLKR